MKQIDISTKKFPNTFALVDDKDYLELNRYKWRAYNSRGKIYAQRAIKIDGKWKSFSMHVVIMGRVEGKEIDHRSGNGLDNQRHNMRHCTHAENTMNQGLRASNTSGYKGVSWHKGESNWRAQIRRNGKVVHLGSFTCLIKAAKCYDEAAGQYHGEFARLNF
jgi:hypothetical protein